MVLDRAAVGRVPAAVRRPRRRVDGLYVLAGLATIVCSGTFLPTPAILSLGLAGAALLASGRPISTGWALLSVPPIAYVILGVVNGQLTGLRDFSQGLTTDFRVIGFVPIVVFMAMERHSPGDAQRTLVGLVNGVTVGLAFSVAVGVLTNGHGNLPFSSHHALGFAATVTLVTVVALPAELFRYRPAILAISGFALISSGSRSGLAAAAAALVAVPVLRLMMGRRAGWTIGRMLRFGAMCLVLAAAASVVAPQSLERATSTISSVVDSGLNAATFGRPGDSGKGVSVADRNVAVRLGVWDRLSTEAGPTAVLRVDAGTVDDILSDTPETEVAHRVFSAHNFYLQLVVEIGWIGMIAYVGLSTIGVRMLMRGRATSTRVAIASLWIAVLTFGLTSNSLLSPAVMVPFAFFVHLLDADPERRPLPHRVVRPRRSLGRSR